jgi:hypothetical protein
VVGIDEKTILRFDLTKRKCQVLGLGSVTCLSGEKTAVYPTHQEFSLERFGEFRWPDPSEGLPEQVWEQVLDVERQKGRGVQPVGENRTPTSEVMDLMDQRQTARIRKELRIADKLRRQIVELGWQVVATPDGPRVEKITLKE